MMTKKYKMASIFLLGVVIVTLCLFIPYGKIKPDKVVNLYGINDVQRLRIESPMIYDDFRDLYIFSSEQMDSAMIFKSDFKSRVEVLKLPSYFDYWKADNPVSFNDSFALYKLRENNDIFRVSLFSQLTETVGNPHILSEIDFRYSSGFYKVDIDEDYNIWLSGIRGIHIKNLHAVREMPQTMDSGKQIIYEHPLLYIPYPIDGSTPYIFSDRIFSTFDFDTRFCEKRNYYATMYKTELPLEQMCRVLCYDGNGVLAEIKDEYNAVKYPMYLTMNIMPSGCWDKRYKAYVESPKSLILKSKFIRKSEPDPVWNEIRTLSTKIDTIPIDYDPAVFVNVYNLIVQQNKVREK